ncbi:hypothetical protein EVG20_g2236 [Dentipellis fragilis]|uniref:RRM domain-containing protein n=1 Tax=Dentipellis fragilis TaxID=205917 RepID=A0A4Y9Z8B5_9AGAM|nr:hypothetical protein EVG20_g2236 [Dentipellis fragilis]
MPRILFVSGFHPATRARDLAYEFERYGPLVRCDVPAPRNPHAHSNPRERPVEFQCDVEDAILRTNHCLPNIVVVDPIALSAILRCSASPYPSPFERSLNMPPPRSPRSYAFVEFRSNRDAEDAYYDMHGRHFEGSRLSIQVRIRCMCANIVLVLISVNSGQRILRRRCGVTTGTGARPLIAGDRDRSRSPRRRSDRDRDRDDDRDEDRKRERRRSRSPDRRRRSPTPEKKSKDEDRARTPPPAEEVKKDEEKARSPSDDH